MALDLLIRLVDKPVGDGTGTEDDDMMVSQRRGAIVAWFDAGNEEPSKHLQGRQGMPANGVIRSDVTVAQITPYLKTWRQDLDWTLQSLDTALDKWHGEVFATAVRDRDGRGSITQAQAENYMRAWNVSNHAFAPNSAAGDFTIYDLATSRRFWDDNLDGIEFSELGYDEPSGQHQIRLNYGGIPGAGRRLAGVTSVDDKVARLVGIRAEIERHNTAQNRIDFNVWRGVPNHAPEGRQPLAGDDMIATVKQAFSEEIDEHLGLMRWRIKPGVCDQLAAASGFAVLTPQELQAALQDYCDA